MAKHECVKAVMISIQPKWCGLIASNNKTLEIRKTRPKIETPFKCYIYCTQDEKQRFWTGACYAYTDEHSHNAFDKCGNGKVIGEFVCDCIMRHCEMSNADIAEQQGRIRREELLAYSGGKELFGWHISNRKIYSQPKELSEFYTKCNEACEECDLWQKMRVNADEYDMDCSSNLHGYKLLKRSPQSWCYVKPLDN